MSKYIYVIGLFKKESSSPIIEMNPQSAFLTEDEAQERCMKLNNQYPGSDYYYSYVRILLIE